MKEINIVLLKSKDKDMYYPVSHKSWSDLHNDVGFIITDLIGDNAKHDGSIGFNDDGIYFGFDEIIERTAKLTGDKISFEMKGIISLKDVNNHIKFINLYDELCQSGMISGKRMKI